MNPLTAGVLTIGIVTTGKWVKGESLEAKHALAAGFAIIMLMVFESANKDLARAFGLLFVVAAALTYAQPIAERVNK